ncbi:MAG: zinc ribbon domain-containing protein [Candidatus Thermoplasmatota archaeon]|nr:zinc ribbon domain-containing protein [Candidatus Thermoplasmatota archaeon]
MEELSEHRAPVDRIKKIFGDLFNQFKKTPYTVPVAIGVTGLVYYLMMAYVPGSCWIGLIPSLLLFGILWQFGVTRVKKLLVSGLIAAVVIVAISTVVLVDSFQNMEMAVAVSPGTDPVLFNGTVSPTTGGDTTVFTFNLTVRTTEPGMNVTNVCVNITSLMETVSANMTVIDDNATLNETYYIYQNTLSAPINQFHFAAIVNGTWVIASDYLDGKHMSIVGPVFSDPWAVAVPVIQYVSLYQAFLQFFPIFAILCGMVWWMRRARRMREDAVKNWEKKRKDVEAKVPEDDTKVPSLQRAMGLEGEPETFVCSDCGADVPSDAKECPSCGEKFD